jgi:hypothetical protein
MTLTASQVLHQHVLLADRMRKPDPDVADFLRYHMNSLIKDYGRASSMFHPIIRAGYTGHVDQRKADDMCRLIGGGLTAATTYQVAANMVADMRAVFERTWLGPDIIHSAELPALNGFAWLDTPWKIGQEESFAVRAMSWQFAEVYAMAEPGQPDLPADEDHPYPCVRVSIWRYQGDITDPEEKFSGMLGSLLITHSALIPLNMPFSKRTAAAKGGETATTEAFLALIHLLWMFLGMEITASERAPIKAGNLKRAARTLVNPEVRVVLLRRLRHATDAPGTSRDVDWRCRWIVQGHYRHKQRPDSPHRAVAAGVDKHCARCGGELQAWVAPYIKGPDGLPLRATEQTLMRLAR